MKSIAFAVVFAAVSAQAQVRLEVQLPSIVFPAPPPLVMVQPGVQVVQDSEDEVFFVDNYYWHHRGSGWFRTKTHTGGWVAVEPGLVPRTIVAVPEGKYRRWKAEKREEHREKREEKEEHKGKHGKH